MDLPAGWTYSESTASSVLSAIVSAMVGLTGFVVAFGVLVVQMATQTLSPRFMRLWYRDGLQKAVLGTFVGTLTFALALLRRVGPGLGAGHRRHALRAWRSRRASCSSSSTSIASSTACGRSRWPGSSPTPARRCSTPCSRPLPTPIAERSTPARHRRSRCAAGGAGAIQAIDKDGLLATAIRHDCLLVLPHAVGDIVPHGDVVLQAYGPAPPPAERLRGLFVIGEERTIEQDPAFALRILVDIAIRALSPAVNDPTTTVQVLGAIEDLLILIGESDLRGRGELRDDDGTLRVVVETRRWEDLLALALTEIREYGATATQVTRRTHALLDRLEARVRPEHRAAVADHAAALDAALERKVLDPSARAFAGRADPQGIGGSSGWEDARPASNRAALGA